MNESSRNIYEEIENSSRDDLFEEINVKIENTDDDEYKETIKKIQCKDKYENSAFPQFKQVAVKIETIPDEYSTNIIQEQKFEENCTFNTDSKVILEKNFSTDLQKIKCEACDKCFMSPASMKRHKLRKHGRLPRCNTCGKYFPNESSLDKHQAMPAAHLLLDCMKCAYTTFKKDNLRKHLHKHAKEKRDIHEQYECANCPFVTRYKLKLIRHCRQHLRQNKNTSSQFPISNVKSDPITHSDDNLNCNICHKSFKTVQNLNIHKRLHTDLVCRVCYKKFPNIKLLNKHKAAPDSHKKYICDKCSYSSVFRANIIRHLNKHSEDAFLSCDICEKIFKSHRYLKQHKLLHDGSLGCSVCRKRFPSKRLLDKHKDNYSRYKCDLCAYSTCSKAYMKRHLMIHHKGDSYVN